MALKTTLYDTADYLTTPYDIFLYLEAELEQEEPPYWPGAIAIVARARGGFEELAEETAIPVEELRRAADEANMPNRDFVVKVMEAYRHRV